MEEIDPEMLTFGGVDPWHTTGSSKFHKSEEGQSFLELCQTKLSKLKSEFAIGGTGYPDDSTFFEEDWGWTTDVLGRKFVCTPKYYIFQRMSNGHTLMFVEREKRGKTNWLQLYGDKLAQINEQVSSL